MDHKPLPIRNNLSRMNQLKAIIIFAAGLSLTGCLESRKNTEQLCADTPSLQCERLNVGDGQCRVPRTDLIWHRFELKKQPTDENKVKEYQLTYAYKRCLELASQIQPIDQTGLKQRRFDALINAGEDLDAIIEALKESKSPQALYFLWSQTGSDAAKRSFLQLEGKPELETAEMQYALATFYTGRDQEKTRKLLLHSLELSADQELRAQIIQSLASTTHKMKMNEHAYIWAKVAQQFDISIASESELNLLYGFDEERTDQLQDLAEEITDAIDDNAFDQNLVPQFN